jgi:hypothetical protein
MIMTKSLKDRLKTVPSNPEFPQSDQDLLDGLLSDCISRGLDLSGAVYPQDILLGLDPKMRRKREELLSRLASR